jgi:Cu(I)/Ag(I) efflux system protein CusF
MRRLAFLLALLLALPAFAQQGETEGEVRKVDREAGKITLRHGPIGGDLDMSAMSMVFQVKDAGLLDRLQQGDRVKATILKENGVFYIVKAEKEG